MKFTESELRAIVAALRVAAVQYAIDAEANAAYVRVLDHFRKQQSEAIRLADRIEEQS
jgi:hypothetical protein